MGSSKQRTVHFSFMTRAPLSRLPSNQSKMSGRLNPDGTQTTLAAFYEGKRINSPNDLTFGPQTGDLYLWVPLSFFPSQKGGRDGLRFCSVAWAS